MIEFGREECRDLGRALTREWLETNGLGGYASSTIIGLNTRRYHGLLMAAVAPPVGRALLLSKLEETLIFGGRRHDLSANQYPGAIHPQGFRYLDRFALDPFPTFVYSVEGVTLVKTVFMVHGENTTVVRYAMGAGEGTAGAGGGGGIRLEIRPLIAFRDDHSTTHRNDALRREVVAESGSLSIRPYDALPALHLAHDAAAHAPVGEWYLNLEYAVERERGFEFAEDLYCPAVLTFDLSPSRGATVIASTERRAAVAAAGCQHAEEERRRALVATVGEPVAGGPDAAAGARIRALTAAADQYVVARGDRSTVIAGYPWFTDWGRDTMVSLPGLALVTGRFDAARGILLQFARHVDRGLIPNLFPDGGEAPEYNTVDATLWYFEAVSALLRYTEDLEFVRAHLYEVLRDIAAWHVRGTRHGIRVEDDGLLASGEEGVQLTWMDAKLGDSVVTPRRGKPVEVQALWYNALRVLEELAEAFGDEATRREHAALAQRAKRSFNAQFWNEAAGCLYDVVDGERRDASIRPNQILAVSLPHSMLSRVRMRTVVDFVERELLTPVGLRSLAPTDPRYRGAYTGDLKSREHAYHQGTVWPWLLRPFVRAYLRTHGATEKARARAAAFLEPLDAHLLEAGLGQISEIFDGDPPHRPRGCIAQAWSVAEILRATAEDVLRMGPAPVPATHAR